LEKPAAAEPKPLVRDTEAPKQNHKPKKEAPANFIYFFDNKDYVGKSNDAYAAYMLELQGYQRDVVA